MTDIEQEYTNSLKRAFVDGKADYVYITSRRQEFLIKAAQFGQNKGWLSFEEVHPDSQSTEWRYRLTEKGRQHFGLDGGNVSR